MTSNERRKKWRDANKEKSKENQRIYNKRYRDKLKDGGMSQWQLMNEKSKRIAIEVNREYQKHGRGISAKNRYLYQPDEDELIMTQKYNGVSITLKEVADILQRTLHAIMSKRARLKREVK